MLLKRITSKHISLPSIYRFSDHGHSKEENKIEEFDPRKSTVKKSFDYKNIHIKTYDLFKYIGNGTISWIKEPQRAKDWYNNMKIVVKRELKHYWLGSKLLVADTKTSFNLSMRILNGEYLTRRERRVLVRTSADLFRLVPFSFFVIVPFAEFSLPFFLKIFPNMLPSQFQEKYQEEEKTKRQLALRLDLAEFLNDTLLTIAKDQESKEEAKSLADILSKVRDGQKVSNEDLLSVAKLFRDDITLDNISRPQLVSMCKYMGLSPYGPELFLRSQLKKQLLSIERDDEVIMKEGLNSLTLEEVKHACAERGMRASGVPAEVYRRHLAQWLELSLKLDVPASLLILSRTFTLTEKYMSPAEAISSTIISLEEDLVEDAMLESGHLRDQEKILESKHRQNEKIKEEREEVNEVKEKENELLEATKGAMPPLPPTPTSATPVSTFAKIASIPNNTIAGIVSAAANAVTASTKASNNRPLSTIELRLISEALSVMASDSAVAKEREKLEELKVELKEITDDDSMQQDLGTKKMSDRLAKMISRLEVQVNQADKKIGNKLSKLDTDKDGIITRKEIHAAVSEYLRGDMSGSQIAEILDSDKDGKVAIKSLDDLALDQEEVAEDIEKQKDREEKVKEQKEKELSSKNQEVKPL